VVLVAFLHSSTMVMLPEAPLKLKNTFIDVDERFIEDHEDPFFVNSVKQRQMSEPAMSMFRQTSGAPYSKLTIGGLLAKDNLAEVSDDSEEKSTEAGKSTDEGESQELRESPDNEVTSQCQQFPGSHVHYSMPAAVQVIGYDVTTGAHVQVDCSQMATEVLCANQAMEYTMAVPCDDAQDDAIPPPEWTNTYTVMMRNLPNKYTQQMLVEEINTSGFMGTFDFLYLPIDPETNANKGYAFINFMHPNFAWMFRVNYEGCMMKRFNSSKHVSVAPATLQGFEANHAHYSRSRVNRGDPTTMPLFLREPDQMYMTAEQGQALRRRRRRSAIDVAAQRAHNTQQRAVPSGAQGSTEPHCALQVNFCAFCGGSVQEHFKFCQFCGAAIQGVH